MKKQVQLKLEMIELLPEEIIPYKRNNKDHRPYDISEIAKSIRKNGYIQPITVDENHVILTGHGRLLALKQLGYEKIRVLRVTGFEDERQKRDYRIRDNTTNWLARFDTEMLILELSELGDFSNDIEEQLRNQGIEIDLSDLGDFTSSDRTGIGEDEVPELKKEEKIEVQLGDIFELWEHRIMCWDSTSKKDVDLLMREEKADLIFTDPPYNVDYEWTGENTTRGIESDNMKKSDFQIFLNAVFERYKEHVKQSTPLYVFHASRTQREFETALEKNGFKVRNQIIWNKPVLVLWRGDYHWKHEPCFYASIEGGGAPFYWNRSQTTTWNLWDGKTDKDILQQIKNARASEEKGYTTIWTIKKDALNTYIHPTQKPVELIERALINSSKPWNIVMDLFAWSGSTLIACEKDKRRCRTMELEPFFVQQILKRYHEFTGWEVKIRCVNRDTDLAFLEK